MPGQDVRFQLTPRDDKQWHVYFPETGKPLEISSEDIDAAEVGTNNIIGWDIRDGYAARLFKNRLNMPVECLGSSTLVQSNKEK